MTGQGLSQLQVMREANFGIGFVAGGGDGKRLLTSPGVDRGRCLTPAARAHVSLGFVFLLLPVLILGGEERNGEHWEHPDPFEQPL